MPIQSPFSEEHEAFRRSVRARVAKELTPHALEWDRAGIFPREIFKRAGELGFLGAHHDSAWGGSGGDYWFVVAFTEELAGSRNAGVNMALLVQAQIATPVIGALGSDEQKREWLGFVGFVALGLLYLWMTRLHFPVMVYLTISGSAFLIGLLFLANLLGAGSQKT